MSFQAPFNGGSEASAFTSRQGSEQRSPRQDSTPVTPPPSRKRGSISSSSSSRQSAMDAATATLIGQLVATDMARQDHKDKATSSAAAVIVKQRPPPPHRTNSHSQHSRTSQHSRPPNQSSTAFHSPVSLSQHLQRTSVPIAAAAMSTSTVTHTTASPPPRSMRSQESDRKPAAIVTPALLLPEREVEDSPKSYNVSPRRIKIVASVQSAKLVSPTPSASSRAHGSQANRIVAPPPLTSDHDRMMQEKRRSRVPDGAAVVTPRQKYLRDAGNAFSSDGDDVPSTQPPPTRAARIDASDDALAAAKRRERERGPALAAVRRTTSHQSSKSTPPQGTPSRDQAVPTQTLSTPKILPDLRSSLVDEVLQQAKRHERERGPALASVVRRTTPRQSTQRTHHQAEPPTLAAPQTLPRSSDDVLQRAKQEERERGPMLLAAATRRNRTDRPKLQEDSMKPSGASPWKNPDLKAPSAHSADGKQQYSVASAHYQADDDDASTDSAYALAMARSHLRMQDKLRSEESAGPSLATATGAVEVHPGAVAFVGQELHRKSALIEAQAGVPVPGAFAVQGISSPHDDDSMDSEEGVHDPSEMRVEDLLDLENPRAAATTLETTTPLEAEVYEQVVVDGAIADTDDDEETLDPKTVRRLRTVQLSILGFAVLAVGIIIGSILGFASKGGGGNGGPPPLLGWQQVGSTLFGETTDTPQTLFGSALELSADGQRLAVAAPGTDNGTALNVGTVYLLEAYQDENGTNWRTLETLAGPGPSNEAHTAVALVEQSLVVGYSRYTQGRPVQVFQSSSQDSPWQAAASVPMWNASEDAWWGYAVDLSADGTILAVGAPRMNGPYGVSSGVVQVFQLQQPTGGNVSWVPMGASLYGTSVDEFFGWTLSLSAGPRLAVGAPVYNDTSGVVRIYDWNGEVWLPGGDLRGDVPLGRFGESVALSGSDGIVLAVGARGSAFDEGNVMVYRERNGQWVLDAEATFRGQEIGEGFGASVALSLDGGILAVGAPQSNYFGKDTGAVSVYRYSADEGSWRQHGSVLGSATVSEFGASVTLSDDGLRVAGGAPTTAFDGSVSRAGCALVYDLVELSA
jgi:hypothetical protein